MIECLTIVKFYYDYASLLLFFIKVVASIFLLKYELTY